MKIGVLEVAGEYAKLTKQDKEHVDNVVEERQLEALCAASRLGEPSDVPMLRRELRSAKTLTRWRDEVAEDLVLVRKRALPAKKAPRHSPK